MNPLIAIPSPRSIPQIIEALREVNQHYDLLWLKHMPEYLAYKTMRHQFLNHPNDYTHLVICPDDLLISSEKLDALLKPYSWFNATDPDNVILSGYCNVDTMDNRFFANITTTEVQPERNGRTYKWLTLYEVGEMSKHPINKTVLLPVKFAGFPLFVIPRRIVEQIPFRNDSPTGKFDSCGCCVDVMFCHDALEKGYEIFVNTKVRLDHLKISDQETSASLKDLPLQQPHLFYEYAANEEKKIMVN